MAITKRDYFAAQALTGLLSRPGVAPSPAECAAQAFHYADEMLKLSKTLMDPVEVDPAVLEKGDILHPGIEQ